MNYNLKPLIMTIFTSVVLFGCSTLRASDLHIYTPEEQAGMTEDGAIATMITPSELLELSKRVGKSTKPTGHISYCNAGLMNKFARGNALKSIDEACGGKGQYTIVRAVPMLDAVSTAVGTSCTRSEMIIFRCNGAQLKQP